MFPSCLGQVSLNPVHLWKEASLPSPSSIKMVSPVPTQLGREKNLRLRAASFAGSKVQPLVQVAAVVARQGVMVFRILGVVVVVQREEVELAFWTLLDRVPWEVVHKEAPLVGA